MWDYQDCRWAMLLDPTYPLHLRPLLVARNNNNNNSNNLCLSPATPLALTTPPRTQPNDTSQPSTIPSSKCPPPLKPTAPNPTPPVIPTTHPPDHPPRATPLHPPPSLTIRLYLRNSVLMLCSSYSTMLRVRISNIWRRGNLRSKVGDITKST